MKKNNFFYILLTIMILSISCNSTPPTRNTGDNTMSGTERKTLDSILALRTTPRDTVIVLQPTAKIIESTGNNTEVNTKPQSTQESPSEVKYEPSEAIPKTTVTTNIQNINKNSIIKTSGNLKRVRFLNGYADVFYVYDGPSIDISNMIITEASRTYTNETLQNNCIISMLDYTGLSKNEFKSTIFFDIVLRNIKRDIKK